MSKKKIFVMFWLLGILIPLNWIERLVADLRRGYWLLTGSEPVHVLAHLVLFSGWVILLLHVFQLPLSWRTAVWMAVLVLALGLGQEFLQLQVKQRNFGWPEAFDLGVDLTAGVLGWLGYQSYLRYGRYLRMAYYMLREI